jgi:ubiquinone/menaquinone biosynthesis C-methylase UbiE
MVPVYDAIGTGYGTSRQADARIVGAVLRLLAPAPGATIAEIGAGTGNYSRALADRGYLIKAIEPSAVMRSQVIPHPHVELVEGASEAIPLPDDSVSSVVNILSFHHYSEPMQAMKEMARVAGSGTILIFTFDPRACDRPWMADYFPSIWDRAFEVFPPLSEIVSLLEAVTHRRAEIKLFLLPHDVTDLFFGAGWRRPEIYLKEEIRANMSAFALADPEAVKVGITRLSSDLASGEWRRQHGAILGTDMLDVGYRFLKAGPISCTSAAQQRGSG